MESVEIFVFFVGLCGNLALATPIDTDPPVSINLKLVAVVDGKSFFADNTTLRNWTESKSYCEGMNMKFAAITSQAQVNALKAAYTDSDFHGNFWTSGRDAQEKRQFTWDSTGETVSENYTELWIRDDLPYQTCLLYHSFPTDSRLHFILCRNTYGFWTSGRDAQERRQFTWNSTGGTLSENYTDMFIRDYLPYQTCVLYFSYPSESQLHFWKCDAPIGTLCSVAMGER